MARCPCGRNRGQTSCRAVQHACRGLDGRQCGCAGAAEVVVAGGMESMSRVPYYATGARAGLRMGHAQLLDGMLLDGLWRAPYPNPTLWH